MPILLYNIPGNAVNALSPRAGARGSPISTRSSRVKESSGDWNNFYATLIAVQRPPARVLRAVLDLRRAGGRSSAPTASIDCFPNVWRRAASTSTSTPRSDGDRRKRAGCRRSAVRLTDLFTSGGRTLYPATKAAMDMLGLPGGGKPRPPLQPLEPASRSTACAAA